MKRLIPLLLFSMFLSGWTGDRLRGQAQFQEQLSLPPNADFLVRWNFGLSEALAAGYWLQMLSTIGGWMVDGRAHDETTLESVFTNDDNRRWMYQYLDGITRLAPQFEEPYLYAGIMFYWYGQAPQEAAEFLERGWENGVNRWEIPFYLGMFAHRAEDSAMASTWMQRAARHPRAPAIVPAVASSFSARVGAADASIEILEAVLTTLEENHPFRYALEQDLMTQRQLLYLNAAADAYRATLSEEPYLVQHLVREGFITDEDMTHPTEEGTFLFSGSRVIFVADAPLYPGDQPDSDDDATLGEYQAEDAHRDKSLLKEMP